MAELIAAPSDTITAEAKLCDAPLATGLTLFSARSVAETLGIPYVYATSCPVVLPRARPPPQPGPAPQVIVPQAGDQPYWSSR